MIIWVDVRNWSCCLTLTCHLLWLQLVRRLREKMTGAGKDALFWTLKSLSTRRGGMGELNRYWGGQVLLEPFSGPDKERKWVLFLFPDLLALLSSGERVGCYLNRRLIWTERQRVLTRESIRVASSRRAKPFCCFIKLMAGSASELTILQQSALSFSWALILDSVPEPRKTASC